MIRSFSTVFFFVEIDPLEIKQMQQQQDQQPKNQHMSLQQQPLNIQSVIRRYPGAYNGDF